MTDQPTAAPDADGAAQEALRAQVHDAVKASGLKQTWIADKLNVSEKHLSQLLTGRVALTLAWADRILTLCQERRTVTVGDGAPVDYLAAIGELTELVRRIAHSVVASTSQDQAAFALAPPAPDDAPVERASEPNEPGTAASDDGPSHATVTIRVHAPNQANADRWAAAIRDLVHAEHGEHMQLHITINPEEQQ